VLADWRKLTADDTAGSDPVPTLHYEAASVYGSGANGTVQNCSFVGSAHGEILTSILGGNLNVYGAMNVTGGGVNLIGFSGTLLVAYQPGRGDDNAAKITCTGTPVFSAGVFGSNSGQCLLYQGR